MFKRQMVVNRHCARINFECNVEKGIKMYFSALLILIYRVKSHKITSNQNLFLNITENIIKSNMQNFS